MNDTSSETSPVASQRQGFLQHHFDTPRQQYEAAKLGMWMFLATEVLLFGGLFCAYAVYRANHPEVFTYGSQFLDTGWGAINTVVLILSSMTMAIAVWCAQCGRRRELVLFLSLTLMCAVDFLGIKYIEYTHKFHDNLVWGMNFYEDPHPGAVRSTAAGGPAASEPPLETGEVEKGRQLYLRTCLSCHGAAGEGLPGLGKPLRANDFIAGLDDAGLLRFLNRGRPKNDPLNTTGLPMLPKGGNPLLRDQDLMHIIAFLRELQGQAGGPVGEPDTPAFIVPRSVIAQAPAGPTGIVSFENDAPADEVGGLSGPPDPRYDENRPHNAHLFFGIYFSMTGLHGLHVVVGMFVIGWLLIRSLKGHFTRNYYTPVDLGGLYWHIVDLIWIFLFPLLYLIR